MFELINVCNHSNFINMLALAIDPNQVMSKILHIKCVWTLSFNRKIHIIPAAECFSTTQVEVPRNTLQKFLSCFYSPAPIYTQLLINLSKYFFRFFHKIPIIWRNETIRREARFSAKPVSARPFRHEAVSARRLFGAAFSEKMRVCEAIK